MDNLELKTQIADLKDQLKTLSRKHEKVKTSYRAELIVKLLDECRLIPTRVAKSGLYEEDIRRILG